MSPAEVKALANLPGFGKAQAAIIAAGHWDEHAAADGKRRKYSVTLTGSAKAVAHVRVDARSKDEAEDAALALLDNNVEFHKLNWSFEDLYDFEVEDSETTIVGEANDG